MEYGYIPIKFPMQNDTFTLSTLPMIHSSIRPTTRPHSTTPHGTDDVAGLDNTRVIDYRESAQSASQCAFPPPSALVVRIGEQEISPEKRW